MKFSLGLMFLPPDQYIPLAECAEENGWDSVNVCDGLFFFEKTSVDYPYSDDGARYWVGETPFMDPWALIPAALLALQVALVPQYIAQVVVSLGIIGFHLNSLLKWLKGVFV